MENMQQQMAAVAHLAQEEKVAFYKKTYSHVAGAVLAFIMAEFILLQSDAVVNFMLSMTQGWRWLIMLGAFMLATNYAESIALKTADKNKQYLAFGLYILAQAIIFVPLLYIAIAYSGGLNLINQAAIVTLCLFAGLSAIVFITKKDFSFLRSILTVGFFIALGLIISGTLFGFDLGLWFSVTMCVLAAGSILYQTSNLIHNYSNDQYIPAALGLFASLMLLFWYIIQIFLSRD